MAEAAGVKQREELEHTQRQLATAEELLEQARSKKGTSKQAAKLKEAQEQLQAKKATILQHECDPAGSVLCVLCMMYEVWAEALMQLVDSLEPDNSRTCKGQDQAADQAAGCGNQAAGGGLGEGIARATACAPGSRRG